MQSAGNAVSGGAAKREPPSVVVINTQRNTADAAGLATVWAWRLAVVLISACIGLLQLDSPRSLNNVDAFVARTAQEMLNRVYAGEAAAWHTPVLNGELRIQKPPLAYWLVMLSAEAAGPRSAAGVPIVTEPMARLPNVFYGVLVAWLTMEFARVLFAAAPWANAAGGLAGLVASGSVFFAYYVNSAATDFGLAFWCLLVFFGVWQALHTPGRTRYGWWIVAALAAGLGMLQKAPMPLAFCGPPILLYMIIHALIRKDGRAIFTWAIPVALVVFVASFGWWVVLIAQQHSWSQVAEVWEHESVGRYTGSMTVAARQAELADTGRSLAQYVGHVLLTSVPWSFSVLFAPLVLLFAPAFRQTRSAALYLVLILLCGLIMLSFSAGREARYILPLLPIFFAALGAHYVDLFEPDRERNRFAVGFAIAGGLLLATVLAALTSWLVWVNWEQVATPPSWQANWVDRVQGMISKPSTGYILVGAGYALVFIIGGLVLSARRNVLGIVLTVVGSGAVTFFLWPAATMDISENTRKAVAWLSSHWSEVRLPMVTMTGLAALALGSSALLYLSRRSAASFGILALAVPVLAMLFARPIAILTDSSREEREMATWIRTHLPPDADVRYVGTVNASLVYYADRALPRLLPPDEERLIARLGTYRTSDYRRLLEVAAEELSQPDPIFLVAEETVFVRAEEFRNSLGIELPASYEIARVDAGSELFTLVLRSNLTPEGFAERFGVMPATRPGLPPAVAEPPPAGDAEAAPVLPEPTPATLPGRRPDVVRPPAAVELPETDWPVMGEPIPDRREEESESTPEATPLPETIEDPPLPPSDLVPDDESAEVPLPVRGEEPSGGSADESPETAGAGEAGGGESGAAEPPADVDRSPSEAPDMSEPPTDAAPTPEPDAAPTPEPDADSTPEPDADSTPEPAPAPPAEEPVEPQE